MEPECSLPHSQSPATCPCPEPDQSVQPPTPLLEGPFYYYPPIYAQVFRMVSFLQVSSPKPCMHLSSPLHMPRSSPISFFFISSPEYQGEVSRTWSFSLRSLLHSPVTSPVQISSSAPYSRTPSAYVSTSIWQIKTHTHKKQANYKHT